MIIERSSKALYIADEMKALHMESDHLPNKTLEALFDSTKDFAYATDQTMFQCVKIILELANKFGFKQ